MITSALHRSLDRPALIIVDVQNDFVKPEGFGSSALRTEPMSVEERNQLFGQVNRLRAFLRERGFPVIYVRGDRRLDGLDYARAEVLIRRDGAWPAQRGLAVIDSWGAQICDEVRPAVTDIVVTKKGHSGMGFTVLDQILRRLGVGTLIATGGGILGCLADTVRQAASHGYAVWVASDAIYRPPSSPMVLTLQVEASIATTDEILELVPLQ